MIRRFSVPGGKQALQWFLWLVRRDGWTPWRHLETRDKDRLRQEEEMLTFTLFLYFHFSQWVALVIFGHTSAQLPRCRWNTCLSTSGRCVQSFFEKIQTVFVNTQRQIVGSYNSAYRQSAYHVNKLMFHIWMEGGRSLALKATDIKKKKKKIQNTAAAGQFVFKPFVEWCACSYFLGNSELAYPRWSCTFPS